ncbi:unnamed protein product [Mycena citricolor]|uniref:Uncharacterized protein n=1 Tax=Mycena citricolor TaxID=2018698 RepID=A0AAD2JZX8_9AGAR|nr:unnamed protein product [Mycena citricolor]
MHTSALVPISFLALAAVLLPASTCRATPDLTPPTLEKAAKADPSTPPTCSCKSPTGCPGRCAKNSCVNYCGSGKTVHCAACGSSQLGCILNTDGSCFTVNE